MDILVWISSWRQKYCNGDWEHENGVKIHTVSNPLGWSIKIDTVETSLENYEFDSGFIRNSESDWFRYIFKGGEYRAEGDLKKLEFLLEKFREITICVEK